MTAPNLETCTPMKAVEYAANKLKRRWEEAEPLIATSAESAFLYADDVLLRRFELGEPAIATDAFFSYLYAMYVLQGRFELGEAAIKRDSNWAAQYKRDIFDFNSVSSPENTDADRSQAAAEMMSQILTEIAAIRDLLTGAVAELRSMNERSIGN